jgi:hypothetical protein
MQVRGLSSHQFRLSREHDKSFAFTPKVHGVTLQTTKKGGQKAALLTTHKAACVVYARSIEYLPGPVTNNSSKPPMMLMFL